MEKAGKIQPARERAARMAPAERRRQLVDCTIAVLARHGLGNAGHAQVADAAGVATATVFAYLPTRQALLDAALGAVDGFLAGMVNDAIASESGATRRLLAVTRAYARAIDARPDVIKVFLNWSTVVSEETWPAYVDFQDRIFAALEAVIRDGIDAGEVDPSIDPVLGAHLVMGAAHMIAQMKFRGRGDQQIDDFLRALIRGVLNRNTGS